MNDPTRPAGWEPAGPSSAGQCVRLLLVVEGTNDVEFLKRISKVLHAHDSATPDLAGMEQRSELIFIPFGGGQVSAWTHRLAPLAVPEFHLYDRELPPETDLRREAAEAINQRPQCQALLTLKRSLENYLHPAAIFAAANIEVDFGDFEPVAQLAARKSHQASPDTTPWELLSRRSRSRLTHQAKRWLNTRAVELMTVELLRQRDPHREVESWLAAVRRLARPA